MESDKPNSQGLSGLISLEEVIKERDENDQVLNNINANQGSESSVTENTIEEIPIIEKQKLDISSYTQKNPVNVYANLYPIKLTKNYMLYQYALKFNLEKDILNSFEKRRAILSIASEISAKYGMFFHAGDSLYAMKEVKEYNEFQVNVHKTKISVKVTITEQKIEMKKDMNYMATCYKNNNEDIKTIFELMIKDILYHNPYLSQLKLLYADTGKEEELNAEEEYNDIKIMPGYATRFVVLDGKFYLNVDLKTKITSKLNCLEIMETYGYDLTKLTKSQKEEISSYLKGERIISICNNETYFIKAISFEKNATNTEKKVEDATVKLYDYYQKRYNKKVNPKAPLLECQVKLGKSNSVFLPSDTCEILGLTDLMRKDSELLKKITQRTKMVPNDKVKSINNILGLLNETKNITKKKTIDGKETDIKLKSPKELCEIYGITFEDISNMAPFKGYIMDSPTLLCAQNKPIVSINRPFYVYQSVPISYLCIYHKINERSRQDLDHLATSANKSYGIKIAKRDYISINSEGIEDWKKIIDRESKTKKYNIIIILFDNYLQDKGLYDVLKKYTLEVKGVLTQFVLTKSTSKNGMSVMSNILLQINSKLGGCSYKAKINEEILKRKMMIVGIDSSKQIVNGKNTRYISCCATRDYDFTQYICNKITDTNEEYANYNYPVHKFLCDALSEYFKINRSFPNEIIIYRQGISRGEKIYLEGEVGQVTKLLTGNSEIDEFKDLNIPFFYIIVNKRPNLKFFLKTGSYNRTMFENPNSGFLVCDNLIDDRNCEFYIQPQKVTQGTATPTSFNVAFGNMKCFSILPKLTFDLCFLYSNWKGPVRVPAPLKYAEKLSKTKSELNPNLKNSLSFI